MKKILLAVLTGSALLLSAGSASAQVSKHLKKKKTTKTSTKTTPATPTTPATSTSPSTTTATPAAGTPSSLDMSNGIKQALELGASYGADRLSAKDGFLGNAAVKILFPEEAQKVERTLRSIGLGSLCDNVITSLNRAAEDAAKEAKPIFLASIKQMTISDATNILLGNKDAATDYFKRTTSDQLRDKFKPVIQNSLTKVDATRYWGDVTTNYNKIPLVKPVNTDLTDYVTQKAIDGLFIEIAKEELKLRDNLGARSSGLLQKVFGFADKKN